MNATRCPVPGCTFEVPWNIPDAPPVSPYITDRAAAVREASRAVAAVEGDRVEAAILAHGEQAHDTATFVEAVLAQQNGP
ncbi:MAG: hypothetical protein NVS3B12_30830 [Acidimicrobiales bacterium]